MGDLLNILSDILSNRKRRVVLNGQFFPWEIISTGVSQGSVLGPLLFLISVNDLLDRLTSFFKLLPENASLFSVVEDISASAKDLNEDLHKINTWQFQWKMNFNPKPKPKPVSIYKC